MIRKYFLSLLFSGLLPFSVWSQEIIFPGLEGAELLNSLRMSYRPDNYLSLSQVRDTLYAVIDNDGGEVYSIYTDHRIFIPEGEDPSQWVFRGGDKDGINLEHVIPKSKGAGDNSFGRTDLHNFRPARVKVNSDRGNFPFMEIDDTETETWYYKTMERSSIPVADIDLWSEGQRPGAFEPRESVKGDLARSIFYFYTMYREDMDNADPNYFDLMREDLCHWHILDEVDAIELERNRRIKRYQGTDNPFVLDCSLAERSYCGDYELDCLEISSATQKDFAGSLSLFYRPYRKDVAILFNGLVPRQFSVYVLDFSGRVLLSENHYDNEKDENYVDLSNLESGLYVVRLSIQTDKEPIVRSVKISIVNP